MSGRRILITGATNGIGLVAAHAFARDGARLMVVGRDPTKTAAIVKDLQARSSKAEVSHYVADLSSVFAVRQLAEAVRADLDGLDVLVNNAGAMFTSRHLTADGYEKTFALNHLGYFVLTNELLPLLRAGKRARIVNVASGAHTRGHIDFDDLMFERRSFSSMASYCQSKLANVLFTRELAKRLEGSSVTVNCLHPGFVRTGFGKNDGLAAKLAVSVGMVFARSPEKGAETVIWLATSPEAAGKSGGYWFDKNERRPSHEACAPDVAERLWDVSEALVEAAEGRAA